MRKAITPMRERGGHDKQASLRPGSVRANGASGRRHCWFARTVVWKGAWVGLRGRKEGRQQHNVHTVMKRHRAFLIRQHVVVLVCVDVVGGNRVSDVGDHVSDVVEAIMLMMLREIRCTASTTTLVNYVGGVGNDGRHESGHVE